MFQKLVSHNDDLNRLVVKGYAVGFDAAHLIVRDIPYLDDKLELQIGAFVAKLVFVDDAKVIQDDHQVYFSGSVPFNLDGKPISNLAGGEIKITLNEKNVDVIVQRSFSNKPRAAGKFEDFFEKIESYVAIISGPAIELHGANPLTFKTNVADFTDPIFKFQDTLTSRADISELSAKFNNEVIAIIGLGGTGSYVLDFMVKTRVAEIRAFDLDEFHVHNAFRSPGRLTPTELGQSKAEVYTDRYQSFRHGLKISSTNIDASNIELLKGVTFAFVCVDKGNSRAGIFEALVSLGIPFIDVGLGLTRKNNLLNGMLRTTHYSTENFQKLIDLKVSDLSDHENDLYKTNIQISELNALNASLAVIKYKQLRGFYAQELPLNHILMVISDLSLTGENL